MAYMGVDIGTSGVKALVFSEDGVILSAAYMEYSLLYSKDGGTSLDSDLVIESCFDVIRESSSKSNEAVLGLSISSQGEAFVPLGENNSALFDAMVSSDTRALSVMYECLSIVDGRRMYEITGHRPQPMFTLYKLFWFRKNYPQIWEQTKRLVCFEDLLHLRLGITPCIGYPLAARTMLFDVERGNWSDEILNAFNIDKDLLSTPKPSGSLSGVLPKSVCEDLGFSKDAVCVCAGHDQFIGALGAGVTSSKTAVYTIGTVECFTPVFDSLIKSEGLYENNLATYNYSLKDMYGTVAFSLTGGNLLKWFRDEFGHEERQNAREGLSEYSLLLDAMPSEPTSMLSLPYFTSSATPYFDEKTKAGIYGIRFSTTKHEILLSLLEGVSFEMKLNMDICLKAGVAVEDVRLIGGGAKSERLAQLKADVLSRPMTIVEGEESGCMGAAMLVCSFISKEKIESITSRWVRVKKTIAPNAKNVSIYKEKFESYKKLYKAFKSLEE